MCKGSSKPATATSAPDPAAMAMYQQLLSRAQGVSNTPYEAYGGQLVADMNGQQQQGINTINNAGQNYDMASNMIQQSAAPITAEQIQRYQDPYTQNVIQATQANFQNQNAIDQEKLKGNAISQGALGGNRSGVASAELTRNQQLAQAPVIADLQSKGYTTGVNTALSQQQAGLAGAQGMMGVGQGALGVGGAQLQAGTLGQATSQAQNEAAYQQWQNEKAYPFQTTQWLANLGTGVGSQMGGTSTQTQATPSAGSQILGAATTGLGFLGSMGFFQQGGRVNGVAGYADGGVVPDHVLPESEDSLLAQQEQLMKGDRSAQMFPKGTPELPMPEGIARTETDRGAFHFDPTKQTAQGIAGASAAGRENDVLDLGPYSKAEIAEYVKNGSPLLAIIERDPQGNEVRAALGVPETVEEQKAAMEKSKSPENSVTVQDFESILADRAKAQGGEEAPVEGLASGGTPKEKGIYASPKATPWAYATGVVPTPEFNMVRGSGAPKPPSGGDSANPASKMDFKGLGSALSKFTNPTGVGNHTPGGFSAAFPDPGASSSIMVGNYEMPVFRAQGGAVGVSGMFQPETLKELYGVDAIPGMAEGGSIYENDEPSPLDPPSGRDRDMAIRTMLSEAGNQGPVGLQAVGSVIRNRAVDGGYGGDTPEGVVTARNQFEPWNTQSGREKMRSYDPNSPRYKEAEEALDRSYFGNDPTNGATHFYAPKAQAAMGRRPPKWDDGTGNDIGDHRFFGGKDGDPEGVEPNEGPQFASAYSGERPPAGGLRVQNSLPRPAASGLAPASSYEDVQPAAPKPGFGGVDWSGEGKLWPSLIAAGLGMMASRSQHMGQAIGEGGLAGMQAYSQMRGSDRETALARERIGLEAKRLQQSADVESRRAREAEWPYTRLTAAQQTELLKPVQIGVDKYYNPVMAIRDPKSGAYKVIDPLTGQPKAKPDGGFDPDNPQPQRAPGAAPGRDPTKRIYNNDEQSPLDPVAEPTTVAGGEGDATIPSQAQMATGPAPIGLRDPAAGDYNEYVLDGEAPRIANQVRAIARGLEKSPNLERKNPYNQYLMEKLREYAPDFDATMYPRRQRTATEFATGMAARNLAATKTLAGHLEHLYETSKKLDNSGYPLWNRTVQGAARQGAGSKDYQDLLKEYETNAKAVADEAAKVFAGQSSALADREEWEKLFSVKDPKNVQMASIRKLVSLVDSRLDAMSDQYNSGMATKRSREDLIEPKYKAIFDRMRKAGNEGEEKKPAAGKTDEKPKGPPKPTLQEFLAKARTANPNASDEKLTEFYKSKYGAQ